LEACLKDWIEEGLFNSQIETGSWGLETGNGELVEGLESDEPVGGRNDASKVGGRRDTT
jgi:hypothetical protein